MVIVLRQCRRLVVLREDSDDLRACRKGLAYQPNRIV